MSQSADALTRYRTVIRRQRICYAAILAVIVVALGVFVGVTWSRGEAAHVTLHTVPRAPATVSLGTPSQTQRQAWRTTDRIAVGMPVVGGTVITYDKRTVRGRDVVTGEQTWSYNRSDRTVCTAVQYGGTTIAIYNLNGNCDEVSAFESGTGKRTWSRTLDIDGQPLNGHATYQWSSAGPTLMITTPSVIYALDPGGGLNRWTYARFGCRINQAVLGSAGALISQTCTKPRCTSVKYCGTGTQLFLRNGIDGTDDQSKDNRDRIKWNQLGNSDLPASAGSIISAVNRDTRALDTYRANGKSAGVVDLSPKPSTVSSVSGTEGSQSQLIWLGGVSYLVQSGGRPPAWATPTASAPTVALRVGEDKPNLGSAQLTVPASSGIEVLDGSTGSVAQRFAVPAPAAGALVTRFGTGFLVSGSSGIVAYR